jgi:hypothetical protein
MGGGRSRPVATGVMLFAAALMILNGLFQLFEGIVGVAKNPIFINTGDYVYKFSTTSWGVIHIVIGAVIMVSGFFVFTGAPWARAVAIFLVTIQAISNFFFLPYFPFWALAVIAIDIFIIWALATAPTRDRGDMSMNPR